VLLCKARHLQEYASERSIVSKDQIEFSKLMVTTNYQDLDLKFMVSLMDILDTLFGTMLEFQIKLQCRSINNIFPLFAIHFICLNLFARIKVILIYSLIHLPNRAKVAASAANPEGSLAHNRGHSKECLTAQQ